MTSGVDSYRQIDIKARVENATPGQLVVLLYEGLLTSLSETRASIVTNDLQQKGVAVSKAMSILVTLRESLNRDVAGELPHNIDRLYDYMQRKLLGVNQNLDVEELDEVIELVITLKSGWDEISKNC